MLNLPNLLLFADIPGAGRFNKESMSQQTAMEALCADVDDLENFQDASGDFIPIDLWKGIKFDGDGNISKIDFGSNFGANLFLEEGDIPVDENPPIGPGGSMDLRWIPGSVISFSVHNIDVTGTVDTSKLPRNLQDFDISFNEFSGDFSMAGLPSTLQVLNIQQNNFSGSLIIADIPRSVHRLFASHNAFTGEINLADLPLTISTFNAQRNRLSGTICLQHIPDSLHHLSITHNKFAQDVLVVRSMDMWKYGNFRLDKEKFGKIVDDAGTDVAERFPE